MFVEVNNFLDIPKHCLKSGIFVAIAESKAESSFLIHHFVSYFLRPENGHERTFLLSFCQSFNHFNSVATKLGCQLSAHKASGVFTFVEGLKCMGSALTGVSSGGDEWCTCVDDSGEMQIAHLYNVIRKKLLGAEQTVKPVLIVDNISTLLDVGLKSKDVIALIHYLKVLLIDMHGGSFIVNINNDVGEDDEETSKVWKYMQHSACLNIDVKGLDSGYCKDVHGQMKVVWTNRTSKEKEVKMSQFKLTDKTCALFALGMSSAVL